MDEASDNIDTLVIIGNGFDRWQDLDTSYAAFHRYYMKNRDRLMKKLRIPFISVTDKEGERSISPVEVIYGSELEVGELEEEFWNSFEESLSKIDAQRLNLIYDKDKKGLKRLDLCAVNSKRLLTKAFCDWIHDCIDTSVNEQFHLFAEKHSLEGFHFPKNCYFINFNYTDTLETRFGVHDDRIFYIHGKRDDREPVIFGHSEHPHSPEMFLKRLGGRFNGLHSVEKALYETDKHVQDNIMPLSFDLMLSGVKAQDIKNIYVLGHSLAMADIEYFNYLLDVTTCDRGDSYKKFFKDRIHFEPDILGDKLAHPEELINELSSIEELHNRMQYTIKRYGYSVNKKGYQDYGYGGNERITEEELESINKKYAYEQTLRNASIIGRHEKMFRKVTCRRENPISKFFYQLSSEPVEELENDESELTKKENDAVWHISCFNDNDKKWVRKVMTALGCKKFMLFLGCFVARMVRCFETVTWVYISVILMEL